MAVLPSFATGRTDVPPGTTCFVSVYVLVFGEETFRKTFPGIADSKMEKPIMETRFLADVMLGRLATWLRLLGCDVEYFREMPDGELVERAARSGRVILTRDVELTRRRKARGNCFLVRGDGYKDQLRQVVAAFSIDPFARLLTRCLRCNEPLTEIDRSAARGKVPPFVFATQREFRSCGGCGRIYWRGTHRFEAIRLAREVLGGRE